MVVRGRGTKRSGVRHNEGDAQSDTADSQTLKCRNGLQFDARFNWGPREKKCITENGHYGNGDKTA
jgi:hypothetical protein